MPDMRGMPTEAEFNRSLDEVEGKDKYEMMKSIGQLNLRVKMLELEMAELKRRSANANQAGY